MKAFTLHEIKHELSSLNPAELHALCIRLARYKKENKELLSYLLFEAHDEQAYMQGIRLEMDQLFEDINSSNLYLVKKSLRKILRLVNKYSKYSGQATTHIELLIYYCSKIKASGFAIEKSPVLLNLYRNQLSKINKLLSGLHEDLQYDYSRMLDELEL